MSWFAVLPVVTTLLAEVPPYVPPAGPVVVVPIGGGQPVAPPPAPAPPAPAAGTDGTVTRWYGGPAVAADVTELALLGGVLVYDNDHQQSPGPRGWWHAPGARAAGETLVLSSLVSGAVVHGLNHHWGRAAGSVALRTGAILAGLAGYVVYALSKCQEQAICSHKIVPAAFALFPLTAMAIDDAFLARETVSANAPANASWIPTLRIQPGLALLGVGSAF